MPLSLSCYPAITVPSTLQFVQSLNFCNISRSLYLWNATQISIQFENVNHSFMKIWMFNRSHYAFWHDERLHWYDQLSAVLNRSLSLSLYLSGNSYSIWSHFLYCGSMQLAIWCGWLHSQFYSGEILRIISTELKIIVTYRIFYSHSIHRPTLSKR